MAGMLDTARFRAFIAWKTGTPPSRVEALTLGSHGDTMVPVPGLSSVDGRPLGDVLPAGGRGAAARGAPAPPRGAPCRPRRGGPGPRPRVEGSHRGASRPREAGRPLPARGGRRANPLPAAMSVVDAAREHAQTVVAPGVRAWDAEARFPR